MLSKLLNASRFCNKDLKLSFLSKYISNSYNIKSNSTKIPDQEHEIPKSEESESRFKNWTGKYSYKAGMVIMGFSGLCGIIYSLYEFGPPKYVDDHYEEDEYSSMNSFIAYPCRVLRELRNYNQTVKNPISDKLLPDPHPLYQPMTLVIEVNDILLHPEWTYKSGWKFKKRPGLELFLEAVSPFFEVVVYTSDSAMNLHPILHQIDPNFQSLHYRLYREATCYRNGSHIKDLSALNRDMKKIIRVDWDKKACSLQPENTLLIKQWTGDINDRDLVDLAAFLRMIATNNLPDVREGLSYYVTFDDPLMEFRRRCEDLKEHLKKVENDSKSNKVKPTIGAMLNRLRKN